MEKTFAIARCVRCGRLLVARNGVKSKTCPYCNLRFKFGKAVVVARPRSAEEARQMLAELKKMEPRGKATTPKPERH